MTTDYSEPRLRCSWPDGRGQRWTEAGSPTDRWPPMPVTCCSGGPNQAFDPTRGWRCASPITAIRQGVAHPVYALVEPRPNGLALRYEDPVDHDALHRDPVLERVPFRYGHSLLP